MSTNTPTASKGDATRFVVAIGASAGGLAAINDLLAELPDGLNAPIVIAAHSEPASMLKEALQIHSSLKIKTVEDGEVLENGTVYIVPGAKHAFFRNGTLTLSTIVQDSGFRPSIDAMFMTLAAEYGERAIAVVLSGLLNDGMRGAQVIYDMGGRTIVQDRRTPPIPVCPKVSFEAIIPTRSGRHRNWVSGWLPKSEQQIREIGKTRFPVRSHRNPSSPTASSCASPPTRGRGRPLSVTATATMISLARGASGMRISTASKCERT